MQRTNEMQPIRYATQACDAVMNTYTADKLPPEGVLFYHQGVFLSGMQRVYASVGGEQYFNYIKTYIDSVMDNDGNLIGFCHEITKEETPLLGKQALQMLDHKQPTILLYDLFDKTGDKKYINAIKTVAESMYYWPVNQYGGYWHMMTQHDQMWLDSIYMAGPLSVMYAKRFGDIVLRERAIRQVFIVDDHMKDENTGLYYHGWDASKKMQWSDKNTGLSSQIWGRAVGWYAVGILDMLDYIPEVQPSVVRLKQIVRDLLTALAKYQDEKSGMWYEVTDKPGEEGNWVESSCTNLFIYSYAKAIRKGILPDRDYCEVLKKAYKGIIDSLYYGNDGCLVVDNICIGTCIDSGTYEHYINRERVKNDLHGMGAFILMCTEMQKYMNESTESEGG